MNVMKRGRDPLAPLLAAVEAAPRIVTLCHTNPDPDAIGSQLGLVNGLSTAFPEKTVRAGTPVPANLAWIAGARPLTPSPTITAADLVIVVDCANRDRIAGRIPAGTRVLKIDHHPNRDRYAELGWVDEQYSSCAEMVTALLTAIEPAAITTTAANALYAGIVGDTAQFSTPETNTQTLATAAHLVAAGADAALISHHVRDLTPRLRQLYGYVLSHLTVTPSGLGHITLSRTVLRQLQIPFGEEDIIVPLLGYLTDVRVWLVFIATPQGTFRVHFRSKKLPINQIATTFGGGGHPLASGAFVDNFTSVSRVIAATDAYVSAHR